MPKIVDDERARQGPTGRPVFLVLIGSFLLIAVYFVGMMLWSGSQTPTSPTQDASRQATSPSASSSNAAQTPTANPAYPTPATPPATGSTAPAR